MTRPVTDYPELNREPGTRVIPGEGSASRPRRCPLCAFCLNLKLNLSGREHDRESFVCLDG